MSDEPRQLAVIEDAPMPVFTGPQMEKAFDKYLELQRVFDRKMPNAIMTIGDKQFRKRSYWRAVSVAFKLMLEAVEERREIHGQFADGQDNFVYFVVYRATSPNGRVAVGDGACAAVEKAGRFKCPHPHPTWRGKMEHFPATTCPDYDPQHMWKTFPPEATEHNVRAHAHTRAYNRAVSNLVGFGEVSAEEASSEYYEAPSEAVAPPVFEADVLPLEPPPLPAVPRGGFISDAQRKRLWAIARDAGYEPENIKQILKENWGIDSTTNISKTQYDIIVGYFQKGGGR